MEGFEKRGRGAERGEKGSKVQSTGIKNVTGKAKGKDKEAHLQVKKKEADNWPVKRGKKQQRNQSRSVEKIL